MKCYASTIVSAAKKEVGTKETGTNITKYSKDFDTKYPEFYNTKKQGAEWCDIFVDWLMVTCFGIDNALRLTCQPKKSCGAGCIYSYGYYKAKKQVGKTPKVGAQIFFGKTEKTLSHTGLVVKVDENNVYTIEGNKNNKVSECTYKKTDSAIFGYGYPAYDEETTKVTEPTPTTNTLYLVQSGDTLWDIAKKCLGKGELYPKIKDANNLKTDVIYVGQKLIIPSVTTVPVATKTNEYIVKKNDNLWDIAKNQLGNGARYREIKELNGLKSDVIRVGQVLKLPNK